MICWKAAAGDGALFLRTAVWVGVGMFEVIVNGDADSNAIEAMEIDCARDLEAMGKVKDNAVRDNLSGNLLERERVLYLTLRGKPGLVLCDSSNQQS